MQMLDALRSLNGHYFDLIDPDRKTVTDIISKKDIIFLPYSEFKHYTEAEAS